jgi:hypothetical protein
MAIFKARIDQKITKALTSKKARERATRRVTRDFNRAKQQFISDVSSDKSSVQVESDPKTIGYFGFNTDEDPVGNLQNSFEEKITLNTRGVRKTAGKIASFKFNIKYPTRTEIYSDPDLSLPWTSKTWVQALQEGLGSIERFIFKPGAGRSEFGYQAKNSINTGSEPRDSSYLDRLRNAFAERLRNQ